MPYRAPRGIISHPAVETCEDAQANGFDFDTPSKGGPRHDVNLREGWHFKGLNWDGTRTNARFSTVAEFLDADPQPLPGRT
jgi:hypothetical protein